MENDKKVHGTFKVYGKLHIDRKKNQPTIRV